MWKRKVFCAKCNKQINIIETPEKQPLALAEVMIMAESRRVHQKATGCSCLDSKGSAWYFGEWEEYDETR